MMHRVTLIVTVDEVCLCSQILLRFCIGVDRHHVVVGVAFACLQNYSSNSTPWLAVRVIQDNVTMVRSLCV